MSVTRATARRKLGELIGPYGVFTAGDGTSGTLIYGSSPFKSTVLPTDAFAYEWVYCPASAQPRVRRITETGLTTGSGTITVDGNFGTAVAAGTVFELSAKLPPARDADSVVLGESTYLGLNEIINLALRHILMDDDALEIDLVDEQRDYDLSAYPWLNRDDRLVDVRQLDALGLSYVPTNHLWELRPSGRGSSLHFHNPFRFSSGSYKVRLKVKRPADTLIKIGSTWTETTPGTGMNNDAYSCGVELDQLLPVGLVFAYRELMQRSEGLEKDLYESLYMEAVQAARGVHGYDHSNDVAPDVARKPVAEVA